jgi:hypothetical protein
LNNNRGNNRRRGRGNNRQQGGGQPVNRIDSRARGNAPQMLEKYRKLAHDAHLNGDRVTEEYYLQFADHYFRVIADQRTRQEEQRLRRDDRWQEGGEGEREDGEYASEYGEGDYTSYDQPHRREREERAPRNDAPRNDAPRNEGRSEGRNETRSEERAERPSARQNERQNERASERQAEPRSEEPAQEGAEAEGDRNPYEPPENPFVRENRTTRGLKPRREERRPRRQPRDESEAAAESSDDAPVGFDPAVLPPAISTGREPAPAADEEPAAEAKPRRRTRRPRPPADDAGGETLEVVG